MNERQPIPVKITPTQLVEHMEQVIVGKRQTLELVLAAFLADGHVLIEDVPGVAKTILARTLARTLKMQFARVQMTPDLLPADLTGTSVWDERTREFSFQPGPVFTQLLLADELNRATPRTQAGLLEAMEERSVSAEGKRHALPAPFFVIATQNPIEQHGVFPLPEAQLDRFLIQISMGYPTFKEEVSVVHAQARTHPLEMLGPLASPEDMQAMRNEAMNVHMDDSVTEYLVRIVRATRVRSDLSLGASPRASVGLHRMARALAYVRGIGYVLPDHIKAVAPHVLRHRVHLTPQARLAGVEADQVVNAVLESVETPIHTGI